MHCQGGCACNSINDLLRARDQGIGPLACANLRAHFPLEDLQLLDGGQELALVEQSSGRFQAGYERAFVPSAEVQVIKQEDASFDGVGSGDNADVRFAAAHSSTITDRQPNRVATQIEAVGDGRAGERDWDNLAPDFAGRPEAAVNINVPETGI